MEIKKTLETLIKQHEGFNSLNFVQQERITAPNRIAWMQICLKCMSYDKDRTIKLIRNLKNENPDFKIIFEDVLLNVFEGQKGNVAK